MAGNGESAQLQENKRKDEYRVIAAEEAQPLYRRTRRSRYPISSRIK